MSLRSVGNGKDAIVVRQSGMKDVRREVREVEGGGAVEAAPIRLCKMRGGSGLYSESGWHTHGTDEASYVSSRTEIIRACSN